MEVSALPPVLSLSIIPEDSADLLSDFCPSSPLLPPTQFPSEQFLKKSISEATTHRPSNPTSIIDLAEASWLKAKTEVVRKENCSCTCEVF